jgi:hypothetical protein
MGRRRAMAVNRSGLIVDVDRNLDVDHNLAITPKLSVDYRIYPMLPIWISRQYLTWTR